MKELILIFVMIFSSVCSFAQSTSERQKELNKANKEFMKRLKDKYDLKYIYVHVEDDGFWYFHAAKKEDVIGILNQQGEIIVPIKYASITYKKPLKEGFSIGRIEKDTVWHRANVGCFHAHTFKKNNKNAKYGIYRLDGTAMVDDFEALYSSSIHEGYIEYAVSNNDSSDDLRVLYTQDGEELVPLGWYTLSIMNKKECKLIKSMGSLINGGRSLYGAMMLDGSLPLVPCQYFSVSYDKVKNQWIVEDPTTYEKSVYNPNKAITSEMKDKGVEMFWSGKFDEVIDFYSKEGIDKPWAKYYSGAALLEKADKMDMDVTCFINVSENGKMDVAIPYLGITNRKYYSGLQIDFNLMKNLYSTGYELMKAYLEEDSTFIKEVNNYTRTDIEWRLKYIDEKRIKFESLWQKYLKENEAIVARQQEERRRAAKRNELLGNIAGIFLNSLFQRNNSSGSNRPPAYSRTTNRQTPASHGVSQRSNSNTSKSSSLNSSVEYRRCHKCSGTGDIFTTSTIATYGNDKKVVCKTCGKEHWASNVHHHKKCDNCNGTGKVRK